MSELDPRLSALVDDLRSPDPLVRDTGAFSSLAALAHDGELDDHLVELGDRALALLQDDEVQARSFGALLLALVADRDNVTGRASDDAVRRWVAGLSPWYADEPETQGFDPDLGWLHAVAHGADAVGELAGSPRLGRDDLVALLQLLVRRATAPNPTYWMQNEDDRVAVAVMAVLRRDLLTGDDVRSAVDALAAAWRSSEGPVTAAADNAVRLARTLHLQLVLGVRPAPDADVAHPAIRLEALHTLGSALADVHWFYGRPS
ncbi:MAG: DUF2785 domain-containing protein [Sporichthyaceae bacterium]